MSGSGRSRVLTTQLEPHVSQRLLRVTATSIVGDNFDGTLDGLTFRDRPPSSPASSWSEQSLRVPPNPGGTRVRSASLIGSLRLLVRTPSRRVSPALYALLVTKLGGTSREWVRWLLSPGIGVTVNCTVSITK